MSATLQGPLPGPDAQRVGLIVALVVGTSGWQYDDWRGVVYPDGLPQRAWLEHFAAQFATVEVNNAFYRLPERSMFERWRDQTPDGFVVAVKVSRYLTHIRRLHDPAEPVARLVDRAAGLGDRLGPVPAAAAADPAVRPRARSTPAWRRFPRARGWRWSPARVLVDRRGPRVLDRHGAALCWADRRGRPVTPLWRTADWGYLRLHRARPRRGPSYGRGSGTWLERVDDAWPGAGAPTSSCYFNNDHGGAAVRNTRTLRTMAWNRGSTIALTAGIVTIVGGVGDCSTRRVATSFSRSRIERSRFLQQPAPTVKPPSDPSGSTPLGTDYDRSRQPAGRSSWSPTRLPPQLVALTVRVRRFGAHGVARAQVPGSVSATLVTPTLAGPSFRDQQLDRPSGAERTEPRAFVH